jgi:urea transporter
MREHLRAIFNSYSEIFFIQGIWLGALLMAMSFINPNVALAGVISVIAAHLFANFLKMDKEYLKSGFYTYNTLLVGLSIGYLFRITPLTIFFVIIAGILTFILTIMINSIFSFYLKIPILSLPFVIVSSLAYLASSQYSNLFVNGLYPRLTFNLEMYLPIWITGFLKSLGAILFLPHVMPGIIVLLVILFSSRILFLLVILGYYSGTLITAALIGSYQQAFTNLNHFNYIWIAIAIGGIFLIPSVKTYIITFFAVATSTMILKSVEVFWSTYGIPAFALPFNLVSFAFIYMLGLTNYPLMTRFVKKSPEESLDYFISTTNRFKGTERTLQLPFSGKWTVWQAFDGKWTHKGSWRHAYDFVITDKDGNTFANKGITLEDYYAFKKPVLSPVRGRVVKVIDTLPDNPINEVDKTNNWGNLVIIYDQRDYYIELSHFVKDSISVKEGDWVEKGSKLGLCGNSGYSPQPHIHVQVQATEDVGSYTLPFSFVSYISKNQFLSNQLPEEGEIVEPVYNDKSLDMKLSFILDQKFFFQVFEKDRRIDQFDLMVKMAPDGTFYFDSGNGKLYFGKYEGTFYFYQVEGNDKYLKAIYIALPKIPLSYKSQLQWVDYIPVGTVVGGIKKAVLLFLASFSHRLNKITYKGTFIREDLIEGEFSSTFMKFRGRTQVELDKFAGFNSLQVNDLIIRRVDIEKTNN